MARLLDAAAVDDCVRRRERLALGLFAAIQRLDAEDRAAVIDRLQTIPGRGRRKSYLPPPTTELLVNALFIAAGELSPDERRELATFLIQDATLETWNSDQDSNPLSQRAASYVDALLNVTTTVGHAPSTSEYVSEYERRRGTADSIPSIAAVLRFFGTWATALAAAGLSPDNEPRTSWARRMRYGWKRFPHYSNERLIECLRDCASELGRAPSVRDYTAWRDNRLGGEAGRRLRLVDIPHFRTLESRFGSWRAAVAAAELNPRTM